MADSDEMSPFPVSVLISEGWPGYFFWEKEWCPYTAD
jgi:hypothetical protein